MQLKKLINTYRKKTMQLMINLPMQKFSYCGGRFTYLQASDVLIAVIDGVEIDSGVAA